jgi:5-methylthioadenosine/S-adenosylhomocysteine deaminase
MHTHSAMSLLRGYADDLNLQVWLNDHIWPAEKAYLGSGFVRDGSRLAIAEMLRGGTTFFNDLYFFPEVTAATAIEAGMRACIGLPVIDVPTVWAANEHEYIDKGLDISASWQGEPLISAAFAPHAPYSVGDGALERIAELSATRDMRVHMHILESSWEIGESQRLHGKSTLDRLGGFGLLNERLLAVHMTQLNGADLKTLAETAVNVIHCPESNLKLGNGICPVARLQEHAINVALGTDGAASNNDLDLLAESRTAALLAKGLSSDPCVLNAFQALEMLTINAAKALGKSHQLGSVEAGKLADLCAIRMDSLQTTPMYDVVSHLIYAASSQQVSHVWVGGRMLLQNAQFLHMDVNDIIDRAKHWAQRIAARTGTIGVQVS